MAITFTDNFLLPLLTDGLNNWGANFNGAMETLDREVKAAQSPLVNRTPEILIMRDTGEVLLIHRQL